jgi:hypothetical protein
VLTKQIVLAPIATQNATPVSVPLMTVPADSIVNLSLTLNARTGAGAAAAFRTYGAVKRVGTDNAQLVGAVSVPFLAQDTALLAITAALSLSGPALMLTVTGLAATMILWTVTGDCLVSQ